MTEKNLQLLELIKDGKTINEICNAMNISYKQLLNRLLSLKKWGINLEKKYYYDGEITHNIKDNLIDNEKGDTVILTKSSDTSFKALLISDLHLGNQYEKIDELNKLYDYAIREGIHIILNTGDLIDGTIGTNKIHNSILEQIEYALKIHPYDKNILNFICLGNHDASTKEKCGFDVSDILKNNRPDLIPIGYGNGVVRVKNDKIILRHNIDCINYTSESKCLILHGHKHHTKFNESYGTCCLYLPSFSDIKFHDDDLTPCAFKMDLKMKNGYFTQGIFNQLYVDSKVKVLNELVYNLTAGKPINEGIQIENEEDRLEEKVLVKKLSQIEKFNKRYCNTN